MEVNLMGNSKVDLNVLNATTSSCDKNETFKKENKNCTTTKTISESSIIDDNRDNNDDSLLLTSLPNAEVKLKKLDESKLLMDKNENSLNVDTLIEILSSSSNENANKLPMMDNIKRELMNINSDNDLNVPPTSVPSTLHSPSSSTSSSSKSGFNSPSQHSTSHISSVSASASRKNAFTSHKKIPSPHYSNGGKPMIADLNKKMKQVGKRQPKSKTVVYQSQISDNSVGIKLCIKKSINTFKAMPSPNNNTSNNKSSRKRTRKPNKSLSSKEKGSDSDDPYVKRRKKPSNESNSSSAKASFEEPIEQSVWGKALPNEVLFEVSITMNSLYFKLVITLYLYFYFRFSRQ